MFSSSAARVASGVAGFVLAIVTASAVAVGENSSSTDDTHWDLRASASIGMVGVDGASAGQAGDSDDDTH